MLSEPSAFTLIAQLTGFFCITMFCPNITLQLMLIIFGIVAGELQAEPGPVEAHASGVRTGVMHGFVNHEMTQRSRCPMWLLALHLLYRAQVLLRIEAS